MSDGSGKARTKPKAVVIGGSMAGLFAALLLRRAGWQVDVYERIGAELAGRGAGIVTHRELFDVLARAGIDTAAAALGVSVPGRRVLDRDGRVAGELALPQVLTSWGRLYGMLKEAIPANCYHHGQNLVEDEDVRFRDRRGDGAGRGTHRLDRHQCWRRGAGGESGRRRCHTRRARRRTRSRSASGGAPGFSAAAPRPPVTQARKALIPLARLPYCSSITLPADGARGVSHCRTQRQ